MEDTVQHSCLGQLWAPEIFRAFRMAMHPRKMVTAFLAVAVICGVGWVMDLTSSVVVSPGGDITELTVYAQDPSQLTQFLQTYSSQSGRAGVFATLFSFASNRFHETLYSWFRIEQLQTVALPETVALLRDAVTSLSWAFRHHPIYSVFFFAVVSVVVAVAGGSICRMAALQLAQDERPGLVESLRFSSDRLVSFLSAFWIPLLIAVAIGLFVSLLGMLGNIPWLGELILAASMPLILVLGVIMVFFIVGIAAGSGLINPAVAYEESESFTAINNTFRYVYAQPWRLGFHSFVAAAYGAMTYLFVRFFAFVTLLVSYRFLQFGFLGDNSKLAALWAEPNYVDMVGLWGAPNSPWTMTVAGFVSYLCALVMAGIVGSYVFSYYYTVSTIIYALLRRYIDGVPISQIHNREQATTITEATTSAAASV